MPYLDTIFELRSLLTELQIQSQSMMSDISEIESYINKASGEDVNKPPWKGEKYKHYRVDIKLAREQHTALVKSHSCLLQRESRIKFMIMRSRGKKTNEKQ